MLANAQCQSLIICLTHRIREQARSHIWSANSQPYRISLSPKIRSSIDMTVACTTLEEVRENIDRLDQHIVTLLAERGHFVSQAAHFKKDTDDVKAPQRVEQVIAKVRALSEVVGANPDVTEQVYRAMIAAFIQQELAEHAALGTAG